MNIINLISEYRNKPINGYFIDLVPISDRYTDDIVNLRNTQRAHYFMNQPQELTAEMQNKWLDEYHKRDNDLYWCIVDKNGEFLGTYRIYDIDPTTLTAEIGSLLIREERANERPYILEATVLVYSFAFHTLQLKLVKTHTRYDNEKVHSIHKKIGFSFGETTPLNEVPYIEATVTKDRFNEEKLRKTLTHLIEWDSKKKEKHQNR